MDMQNSNSGSNHSKIYDLFYELKIFGFSDKNTPDLTELSSSNAHVDTLMTLFMNNTSTRQLAKKITQYNSAAVIGALAYKANINWSGTKKLDEVTAVTGHDVTQSSPLPHFISSRHNFDQALLLIALMKTMIAASKADGYLSFDEQSDLLGAAEKLGFDAAGRAILSELLESDISLAEIIQYVKSEKHKSEVYLAAYFAIKGDNPLGRQFLKDLSIALSLPIGLSTYLEKQADLGIQNH